MKKVIQIIIGSLFIFTLWFSLVFSVIDIVFAQEGGPPGQTGIPNRPSPGGGGQMANPTQYGGPSPAPSSNTKPVTPPTKSQCPVDPKTGIGKCDIPGSPNAKRFENFKCAGNGGEVITIPSCIVGGIFDPGDQEDVKCACCGECRISRFVGMIVLASKFILGASGVVALAIIIYGGFLWILSGGDSQKVEKGKGALTGAVIGVIIILVSWVLINFLLNVLVQDKSIRDKVKDNLIEGLQTEFKANSK